MGAPIARNLLRAGFEVRVWNRSPTKAQGLGRRRGSRCVPDVYSLVGPLYRRDDVDVD
jgi:3-hydroxyisobutyrate dehydrogenase-like beta-hydroxyacid dehydrogenase